MSDRPESSKGENPPDEKVKEAKRKKKGHTFSGTAQEVRK